MSESQEPTQLPTEDELRAAARALEAAAMVLADLSEGPFPLAGTPQDFPRESPADRVFVEGLDVLVEESTRARAILLALAAVRERGIALPPVAFAPVQPYLEAARAARLASGTGRDEREAEDTG